MYLNSVLLSKQHGWQGQSGSSIETESGSGMGMSIRSVCFSHITLKRDIWEMFEHKGECYKTNNLVIPGKIVEFHGGILEKTFEKSIEINK